MKVLIKIPILQIRTAHSCFFNIIKFLTNKRIKTKILWDSAKFFKKYGTSRSYNIHDIKINKRWVNTGMIAELNGSYKDLIVFFNRLFTRT